MIRIFPLFILSLAFVMTACSSKKALPNVNNPSKKVAITSHYDELYNIMQGSYDSSEQSITDETYYDITLHMAPIWTADNEYKWLYVEQSVTANQAKPYRQRLYKLEDRGDGTFASYVYSLKDDSLYIGKWNDTAYFNNLGKDIMEIRQGCEVVLTRNADGSYEGSTVKNNCKSTLRGAAYATSKVRVEKGMITSWDQGFDEKGEQVWGATEGPYIFKIKNQD